MDEIVYFSMNNWFSGRDYPEAEPFLTWFSDDTHLYFMDEEWVKKNELCVLGTLIDMSVNFTVTAKRNWVEKNCPELLTKYNEFVYNPDVDGFVEDRFGIEFLEYSKDNIGFSWTDYDE